jgi:hypothetical protein
MRQKNDHSKINYVRQFDRAIRVTISKIYIGSGQALFFQDMFAHPLFHSKATVPAG